MIDGIPIFHNEFRDRYEGKSFFFQCLDHGIQCLRCVLGAVVAENDGAIAQMFMFRYFFDNGICVIVFPIQGIHVRNSWILACWVFFIFLDVILIHKTAYD